MIQREQYNNFLKSVADDLEGDWLVIGGSLLAIIQAESRTTVDIDLCPLNEMTNELRLSLMTVAQNAGLSIESINPAADFFLKQIPNWKSSIVLFMAGQKGNLYRPSFELYLKLKIERLSQTDIEDCILYYKWNKENQLSAEYTEILNHKMTFEKVADKVQSLQKLLSILDSLN